MINDILNAILASLEKEYSNINKYIEDVEQGFITPCFFVNVLGYDKENLNENDRFLREKETIDIQVIYFPKEEKDRRTEKRQIANIIPNLVRCVEYIQLCDKKIRANSSKAVVVDDTAQVLVSFDFNTVIKFKGQYMEKLEKVGGNLGR